MVELASQKKATIREWIGLGILALTSLVVAIDLFVLLLALPKISADLHASATQVLWITDIYGFSLSAFLITMGTLGDRVGRRRVLLVGSAAFAVASVFVAFSHSAGMLIASRALLGVAGAAIAPAALSLIRHMFTDPKQNSRAISIWLCGLIGGSIVGPLIGGLVLQHLWWGAVFLVGVPPMLLALALGTKVLPEYRDSRAGRLHLPSVVLSLGAVLPLMYGIKELAAYGWHLVPAIALLAGAACTVVFIRQQRRMHDPLIDLALFKRPAFTITLAAMLANTMLPGGVMVLTTQYLQLVTGLTPLQAGLWMIPAMAASIAGFLLSPSLARKIHPPHLIAFGLAVSVIGMLILSLTTAEGNITALLIGFALFNLGAGPLVTLGTGIVIGSAPPQRAGAAAAISQTSNEFGFALGIAVVGSIGTAIYHLATKKPPTGVPANAARGIHDTLASAVGAAQNLPGPLRAAVLHASRNAFVQEYHAVALLSALVLTIIAAAIIVRSKPQTNDND